MKNKEVVVGEDKSNIKLINIILKELRQTSFQEKEKASTW